MSLMRRGDAANVDMRETDSESIDSSRTWSTPSRVSTEEGRSQGRHSTPANSGLTGAEARRIFAWRFAISRTFPIKLRQASALGPVAALVDRPGNHRTWSCSAVISALRVTLVHFTDEKVRRGRSAFTIPSACHPFTSLAIRCLL
jgi:hypothetical protein